MDEKVKEEDTMQYFTCSEVTGTMFMKFVGYVENRALESIDQGVDIVDQVPEYAMLPKTLDAVKGTKVFEISEDTKINLENDESFENKWKHDNLDGRKRFCRVNNNLYKYKNEYLWAVKLKLNKSDSDYSTYESRVYFLNPSQTNSFLTYNQNKCARTSSIVFSFCTKYVMLPFFFLDIVLISKVYQTLDPTIFVTALCFLCLPHLFVYFTIVGITCVYGLEWYYYIPVVNTATYFAFEPLNDWYHARVTAYMSLVLAALMTFPLYIINVAYIVKNENLTDFNKTVFLNYCGLIGSFFTLCVSPTTNLLTIVTRNYLQNGFILSIKDEIKLYFIMALIGIPVIALEIIRFYPFLVAFYVDNAIDEFEFTFLLIMFNLPLLVTFVIMTLFGAIKNCIIKKTNKEEEAAAEEKKQNSKKRDESDENDTGPYHYLKIFFSTAKIVAVPLNIAIFALVPLLMILVSLFSTWKLAANSNDLDTKQLEETQKAGDDTTETKIYNKERSRKSKNTIFYDGIWNSTTQTYFVLVFYLVFGYVGSCIFLLLFTEFETNVAFYFVIVVCILSLFLIGSLPFSLYWARLYTSVSDKELQEATDDETEAKTV